MQNLKHVGRLVNNKRKVVVAYRVVPGEPENCIVVTTENLGADEHDSLMKLVESTAGQNENEFAILMGRSMLPDGRNMLAHFHRTGKLIKVPTNIVEMIPNRNTSIMLSELNTVIARQKGITVGELAVGHQAAQNKPEISEDVTEPASIVEDVITDQKLAEKYRADANALIAEAERLKAEADKLDPPTVKKVAPKRKSPAKPRTQATKAATKKPTTQSKQTKIEG